jgi:hypothetical protein
MICTGLLARLTIIFQVHLNIKSGQSFFLYPGNNVGLLHDLVFFTSLLVLIVGLY